MNGASTAVSASPRYQTSTGLATPIRCKAGMGGAVHQPPMQSVCRGVPRLPQGSVKLRIPSAAILKQHTGGMRSGAPPVLPQSSRGPNPGGTALLKLRSSLKLPCLTKPTVITKSTSMNTSVSASHRSVHTASVHAAGVGGALYDCMPQPHIQEPQNSSNGHLRCMQSSNQTPHIRAPHVDAVVQPQQLTTTLGAHRLAAYSLHGDVRSLATKQPANFVLSNTPTRIPTHTLNAVKLQTGGQAAAKRYHGRVSLSSSGSTCSSVSSRRRPWE